MNESQISVRYAKALFESAKAQEILDDVREDMRNISMICKIPEFERFLDNPVIKESQKRDVINHLFEDKIHALSLSFMNLAVKNGRDQYIPSVARYFIELYRKHKGIKFASVISAVTLPEGIKANIKKLIENSLNAPVELYMETNEDLIGGFVIQIDQQQYDSSVASSLKKVKKQLLN